MSACNPACIGKRDISTVRVDQKVVFVPTGSKQSLLATILRDDAIDRVLVFTRTKHGADRVARKLEQGGIRTGTLHSNRSQNQRLEALAGFKSGKYELMVATDIASRGIDVATDKRSQDDGWWWGYLGSPTAAGGKIYFTTMLGITYVLDGDAKVLDEKALLAVNDLGPVGQTWSLNSISHASGRLYHRSMKEVVCIGPRE